MLEKLFVDPEAAQRHRRGPLGSYLDSFGTAETDQGYSVPTVRTQLWVLRDLGCWLERRGLGVAELDEEVLKRFLASRRRRGRLHSSDAATLPRFLAHLREKRVVRAAEVRRDDSFAAGLERRYETYLKQERGLAPTTLNGYRPFIHRFLAERVGDDPPGLESLAAPDISDFVQRHAPSMARKRAQLMVSALRSFLRFLLQHGEIATDLAACVPTVANWRLTGVPQHLSEEEVQSVLGSCDPNTALGRRDYAILLLLVRLGLRAGEVVRLELDDIDWRAGEILVRGKGSVHDRLPLLHEVGEALAAYLRQGRPRTQSRRVFLQVRAPLCGFRGPATVSTIVAQALKRAGLDPPQKGAHLLRHSLATGMLRRGATMGEIAEVLRHRSPRTTEIYAKVDITGLRSLARAWPGRGGDR